MWNFFQLGTSSTIPLVSGTGDVDVKNNHFQLCETVSGSQLLSKTFDIFIYFYLETRSLIGPLTGEGEKEVKNSHFSPDSQ